MAASNEQPPLNEIHPGIKPVNENNLIPEEESALLIKQKRDDSKIIQSTESEEQTSCEIATDEETSSNQAVILKIKEEPVEHFEVENIEDEQNENVADDVLSKIKVEPHKKFLLPRHGRKNTRRDIEENANKCADEATLNELVNKLIESKFPKRGGVLPVDPTFANNTANNAGSKCKESKCARCTLMQSAFNALACDICRQSLEPLWKLRLGTCSKAYRCKYVNCNKSYARQGDLKIHHRVHTGERPYACSICEKRFSANNNLRRHLKVHTGDKPFICQWCGKRFMTNSCLKRHVRVHSSTSAISTAFEYSNNLLQNQ